MSWDGAVSGLAHCHCCIRGDWLFHLDSVSAVKIFFSVKAKFILWLLFLTITTPLLINCSGVSTTTPPVNQAQVRIASGPPYALDLEPVQQHVQPTHTGVYLVQPGDTLWAIAVTHDVDLEALATWNHIANPDRLLVGQGLHIRDPAKTTSQPIPQLQVLPIAKNTTEQVYAKKIVKEETLDEKELSEKVLGEKMLRNEVLDEKMLREKALREKALREKALREEALREEALEKDVVKEKLPAAETIKGPVVRKKPLKVKKPTAIIAKTDILETVTLAIPTPNPIKNSTFSQPSSLSLPHSSKKKPAKTVKTTAKNVRVLSVNRPKRWLWPLEGSIISTFSNRGQRRNSGIDIAAQMGDPVRATADGIVAYADNALASYGKLILLRHGGSFMSAYAHNDKILVKRGDMISAGEVIAHAGKSGRATSPRLHFELRKHVTPLNPMRYLPKRKPNK